MSTTDRVPLRPLALAGIAGVRADKRFRAAS